MLWRRLYLYRYFQVQKLKIKSVLIHDGHIQHYDFDKSRKEAVIKWLVMMVIVISNGINNF